jgi:transposase
VYEVLARDGPGFALAHCWAHTKRKYEAIAEHWPTACAEIDQHIRDLYAVERLVPGRFPGDAAAQALRHQLRQERSRPLIAQIKTWALEQVGLPRSEFGKAVRYMLDRWTGLTRFLDDPRIALDNNAAERALRGPVVGRKNHYGSKSLRGTQVAALFYTLCESAKLAGVDPHAYLLQAVNAALRDPGTVTLPDTLLTTTSA